MPKKRRKKTLSLHNKSRKAAKRTKKNKPKAKGRKTQKKEGVDELLCKVGICEIPQKEADRTGPEVSIKSEREIPAICNELETANESKRPGWLGRLLKRRKEADHDDEIAIKTAGKSSGFKKCYLLLHESKNALKANDAEKSKKSYVKARNAYINLDYAEKKEVYGELMELYNRLSR